MVRRSRRSRSRKPRKPRNSRKQSNSRSRASRISRYTTRDRRSRRFRALPPLSTPPDTTSTPLPSGTTATPLPPDTLDFEVINWDSDESILEKGTPLFHSAGPEGIWATLKSILTARPDQGDVKGVEYAQFFYTTSLEDAQQYHFPGQPIFEYECVEDLVIRRPKEIKIVRESENRLIDYASENLVAILRKSENRREGEEYEGEPDEVILSPEHLKPVAMYLEQKFTLRHFEQRRKAHHTRTELPPDTFEDGKTVQTQDQKNWIKYEYKNPASMTSPAMIQFHSNKSPHLL